jgi:hypothetical protein
LESHHGTRPPQRRVIQLLAVSGFCFRRAFLSNCPVDMLLCRALSDTWRHVVCSAVICNLAGIPGGWTRCPAERKYPVGSRPGDANADGWTIDGQQGTGRTEPGPLVFGRTLQHSRGSHQKIKSGPFSYLHWRRGRIQGRCNASRRPRPRSPCLAKHPRQKTRGERRSSLHAAGLGECPASPPPSR